VVKVQPVGKVEEAQLVSGSEKLLPLQSNFGSIE
jgi:hypothetical protein